MQYNQLNRRNIGYGNYIKYKPLEKTGIVYYKLFLPNIFRVYLYFLLLLFLEKVATKAATQIWAAAVEILFCLFTAVGLITLLLPDPPRREA